MSATQTKARLKEQYTSKFKDELKKELSLSSIMEVPELKKIVVNVGMGEAVANPKMVDGVVAAISKITGQKALKTKSRIAIAGFKLREDMIIGAKVTLRDKIMYEFFDRLVNIALPRVRDFNGLSRKSFDNSGNYSLGIKEQIIFPEIHFDEVERIHGMDVTLVIKSKSKEHSEKLLEKFNFPFRKK